MGEEIAFANRRISNFQRLVTLTLTLNRVILHTVMHYSSTSTYIPNSIEIERKKVFENHNCCYCQLQSHVTQKLGKNKKSGPDKLQVLCPNLRIRGHLPVNIINGGGDSLWKRPNFEFQGLMTLNLTLDRVILHTVMHHSSTSTYMPNFIEIEEKSFVEGRTDGRTDVRTGGRTFETHFIRLTQRSRPNEITGSSEKNGPGDSP